MLLGLSLGSGYCVECKNAKGGIVKGKYVLIRIEIIRMSKFKPKTVEKSQLAIGSPAGIKPTLWCRCGVLTMPLISTGIKTHLPFTLEIIQVNATKS